MTPTPLTQLLRQLPHPYNEWAISNAKKHATWIKSTVTGKVSMAVACAFYWHQTPEGPDFWYGIFLECAEIEKKNKSIFHP